MPDCCLPTIDSHDWSLVTTLMLRSKKRSTCKNQASFLALVKICICVHENKSLTSVHRKWEMCVFMAGSSNLLHCSVQPGFSLSWISHFCRKCWLQSCSLSACECLIVISHTGYKMLDQTIICNIVNTTSKPKELWSNQNVFSCKHTFTKTVV